MVENLNKPTILIVDDDIINTEILAHGLKSDYRVLMADSGVEALKIAEKENPDAILLDIVMPDMNGIELTKTLKENYDDLYVILVSSLGQDEVIMEAIVTTKRGWLCNE